MRIDLCENKITLTKIKSIICPEEGDAEFLNKIFSPLAKEKNDILQLFRFDLLSQQDVIIPQFISSRRDLLRKSLIKQS